MSADDNIIEFRQRDPDDAVSAVRRKPRECMHRQVWCDDSLAHLTCKACGVAVNPTWWLARFATDWDRYRRQVEDKKKQLAVVAAKLDDAKRELRSVEAKLKRRKAKL